MDPFQHDPKFRVFREGLEQWEAKLEHRGAELEKTDNELIRVVARNSEFEAPQRQKMLSSSLVRGSGGECQPPTEGSELDR